MNWQPISAFIQHGQFDVSGCNREKKQLLRELQTSLLGGVASLGPVEME